MIVEFRMAGTRVFVHRKEVDRNYEKGDLVVLRDTVFRVTDAYNYVSNPICFVERADEDQLRHNSTTSA